MEKFNQLLYIVIYIQLHSQIYFLCLFSPFIAEMSVFNHSATIARAAFVILCLDTYTFAWLQARAAAVSDVQET